MERLLYPMNEAAEVLGVGRSKLWSLVAEGELRTVRVGRRTLVEADELRRFVAHLRDAQAESPLGRREGVGA